jgi:hypothetical protein
LNNLKISNDNRTAIIIGIDKYEAFEMIPTLNGAANDAIEIKDSLIRNGGFEIPDNNYLVGKDATRKNILTAISEVFRQDNRYDLVTFYFSGHGTTEESTHLGYLAPYDYYPEDPFVSGISMEELKKIIYTSKNHSNIIIILDCCYAGIATKDTKTIISPKEEKQGNIYAINAEKLTLEDRNLSSSGKFVLASSEPTALSREKNDCIHGKNSSPHSHGALSYYLIEGLEGKAADPDTGIVNIETLRKYIVDQMILEGKQQPIYVISGASNFDNVIIAVSQQRFKAKIQNLITEVDDILKRKDEITNHVHIYDLLDATTKVNQLINLDHSNKEISKFIDIINEELDKYKQPAIAWLNNNMRVARHKINEIRSFLYEIELPDVIDSLSFANLGKMSNSYINALVYLFAEVEQNTQFSSSEDRRLKILVIKLRATFANLEDRLKK